MDGLIAAQALSLFGVIEGDIERPFSPRRNRAVRSVSPESDADLGVGLAVHHELRRDLDVGAVEIGEFLFPIRIFEFQKEGAQRLEIVKRLIPVGSDVAGLQLGSRLTGTGIGAAPEPSSSPPPGHGCEILPRRFSLRCVEPPIKRNVCIIVSMPRLRAEFHSNPTPRSLEREVHYNLASGALEDS